jgi:hypothetical protein
MRRATVLVLLATVGVLLAGCGGGSKQASPPAPPPPPPTTTQPATPPPPTPPPPPRQSKRIYKKSELGRILLQPRDAPKELGYVPSESGPQTLQDLFVLPRQINGARAYGVRGAYDAVFAAKDRTSDRRISERVWLLKSRGDAKDWLAKSKDDADESDFSPIAAPPLGDESWAAGGVVQVADTGIITHAFRLGNAVFVVSMYGSRTPVSEPGALAAAKAALARAKIG